MSEEESGTKNQHDKYFAWKVAGFVVSLAISLLLFYQNQQISGQNAIITRQYDEIRHQNEYSETWRTKGYYDGAKEREAEYYKMRTWGERVLNHCLKNNCDLPNELTILPQERQFNNLEALALGKPQE